jgi:cellulose biosynthesis protein BcsQ
MPTIVFASPKGGAGKSTSAVVLCAIADQQGWLVSEALKHALAALKRELAGQGRG